MSSPRLTETSFFVLGLLDAAGEATPYDLKRIAEVSVFKFWAIPHSQLYLECERLADTGFLSERREEAGRRRRFYKLSSKGRKAMRGWRAEPTGRYVEMREPAALKLFFGADPRAVAAAQLETHKAMLEEMRDARAMPALPEGMRLVVELGLNQERAMVRFWSRLAREGAEGILSSTSRDSDS